MTLKIRIKPGQKGYIFLIGLCTLLGFPLLAVGVLMFTEYTPSILLRSNTALWFQIFSGTLAGLGMGFLARSVLRLNLMKSLLIKYKPLIQQLNLSKRSIIFLSFCAGFGEELFFRGCLQLFTGIWLCAVIFVAIHGYLNPVHWRLSIYGVVMILISAVFGYLTEYIGIFSAASAHMFVDIVLFTELARRTTV